MRILISMLAMAGAATVWAAGQPPTPADMAADRAAAFAEADADGNGQLTFAEFQTFHDAFREKLEQRMFNAADTDGSGTLSSTELENLKPPHHGGGHRGGGDQPPPL
jgi:hypothetical protein